MYDHEHIYEQKLCQSSPPSTGRITVGYQRVRVFDHAYFNTGGLQWIYRAGLLRPDQKRIVKNLRELFIIIKFENILFDFKIYIHLSNNIQVVSITAKFVTDYLSIHVCFM